MGAASNAQTEFPCTIAVLRRYENDAALIVRTILYGAGSLDDLNLFDAVCRNRREIGGCV